ncbi:hypothetical protein EPO34_03735 [Patescibacteria group bacterium]|nr:MAG: hypothetical protein EPO34_03735 [Patescibacteria group bacterium]
MNRHGIQAIGVAACLLLTGAGCTSYFTTAPARQVSDQGPIKIGFIGPLTGDVASIGVIAQAGAQVAQDEINAAGGINGRQVQVIFEDGKCNAAAATDAANKLINVDRVAAISGGLCSTETSAFGPAAMQNKMPVISYCSSAPTLTGLGKYFFRTYPSDAFQGTFAAEYAYNTLRARKVSILYHVSDIGNGLKDRFTARFQELGGQIAGVEGSAQDNKDYRTQLAKVKASNPDLVYAPMYPDGGTAMVKQYAELGLKAKILAIDAWADPKLQQAVSGKADIQYVEVVMPTSEEFNAKILEKTKGTDVTVCGSQSYDTMKILAQVIGQVGTDPDKMADALHKVDYQGASGHVSFDQNGDLTTAQYLIKEIVGGKGVPVE